MTITNPYRDRSKKDLPSHARDKSWGAWIRRAIQLVKARPRLLTDGSSLTPMRLDQAVDSTYAHFRVVPGVIDGRKAVLYTTRPDSDHLMLVATLFFGPRRRPFLGIIPRGRKLLYIQHHV